MKSELPDYVGVERALGRANVDFSSAEIHGMACGLLVVDQATSPETWLAQALEGNPQDFHVQEARSLLKDLFAATRQQLNDSEMAFELFLPEDDALETRVEAMQDWCQGFSFGLALAGVKDMRILPDDSREWAEDVVRIGSSGELEMEDEEEGEESLAEIIEYLRVGVLMMNEELQPMKAAPHIH